MLWYISLFLILISLIAFFLPEKRAKKISEEIGISIVIPAYNSQETIEKCIESIFNTNYQNLEIIVVNDGSTDKTEERVKKFENQGVLLINQIHQGKYAALNKGFEFTKNSIILILDSDTFLKENSLSKIVNYFKENTGAVVLRQVVENKNNLLTKLQEIEYSISSITYKIQNRFGKFIMIAGSAIAINREAWLSIGGFRDKIIDESDFLIRLIKKGWKIVYLNSNFVETIAPSKINKWFKQRIRWRKGHIEHLLTHWKFFLKNIYLFLLTQPQLVLIFTHISSLFTFSFWTQGKIYLNQNYWLVNLFPILFSNPKIVISFLEEVFYSGIFNFITKNLIIAIIFSFFLLFFLKIHKTKISYLQVLFFSLFYIPFLILVSIFGYLLAIKDLIVFRRIRHDKF